MTGHVGPSAYDPRRLNERFQLIRFEWMDNFSERMTKSFEWMPQAFKQMDNFSERMVQAVRTDG